MSREIYISKICNEKGECIEYPFEFELIYEERIQQLFDLRLKIHRIKSEVSKKEKVEFFERIEITIIQFLYYIVKEEIAQSMRNQSLQVLIEHMSTKKENKYNDLKCTLLRDDIGRLSSKEFDGIFISFLYDFTINVWSDFENGISELCKSFEEEIKNESDNSNFKKQINFWKKNLKDEEILKMLEENKENYIKKFPKYISFFDKVNFIFKRIEKNYSRIIKDDREILLFYSTLRNTIHNGGINRKETKKIEIKGKKIIIEKDKPAFYENYFDVLILIEEIIDIFIEIFEKL
jgi:hypothetical protein